MTLLETFRSRVIFVHKKYLYNFFNFKYFHTELSYLKKKNESIFPFYSIMKKYVELVESPTTYYTYLIYYSENVLFVNIVVHVL